MNAATGVILALTRLMDDGDAQVHRVS